MLDFVVEQLASLLYVVLAGALGVAGFLAESAGVNALTQGQNVLGAWEAVIGLLMLIAAAKLVREKVLAVQTDA